MNICFVVECILFSFVRTGLAGCVVSGQLVVVRRMENVIFTRGIRTNPREMEKVISGTIPFLGNDRIAVFATTENIHNHHVCFPTQILIFFFFN
jgi:hypothetical protein